MHTKLIINKIDNEGRGISYYQNKIVFVYNALIDEEVEVEILKETSKYYLAKVINIIKPSQDRIQPKCPYINECGGCTLMHMPFDKQMEFKKNRLKDILYKYAGIDNEIKLIESNKDLFYRNKITLRVNKNKFSYYNKDSHDDVYINRCLLANNTINDIISDHSFIYIYDGDITIRTNYNNDILLVINTSKYELHDEIPDNIVGIIINDKVVYGESYFKDKIGDYNFKVSYNSFFQINNYIANEIFKILKNNLEGDTLLDLYCGSGVLGISMKNKVKKIIGIEKVSNAIKDANDNAKLNGVKDYKYYADDTAVMLNKINDKIDVIIVDPPRSGLNDKTIKDIIKIMPKMIGYVSCDPMTLARDINILKENYNIKKIYGLDMFPNTYHVETVMILEKKDV